MEIPTLSHPKSLMKTDKADSLVLGRDASTSPLWCAMARFDFYEWKMKTQGMVQGLIIQLVLPLSTSFPISSEVIIIFLAPRLSQHKRKFLQFPTI